MAIKLTDDHINRALAYLASTDEEYAQAKALAEGLAQQRKSLKAMLMLESNAKTDKLKEAEAYAHERYQEHLLAQQNAFADFEILKNKRMTYALKIDMYRTVMSARKQGMMV